MKQSLRVLLASLVDYAGLFPPASLPLDAAVANFDRYRRSGDAWMLGRFVVPAARAGELPNDFPRSVLGAADAVPHGETVEVKAASADDIARIADGLADGCTAYVEVADIALIERLAPHGLRAKIRTGGITADAIPSHDHVARFIRACAMAGVPFKATAGLHHPLRCLRPLTYEADAPRGTMHGFVNVFMAAALVHDAERVLVEEDPMAFRFDDDSAAWRGREVGTEHLALVREEFAIAFGSCSFEEPIEDLRALGWM